MNLFSSLAKQIGPGEIGASGGAPRPALALQETSRTSQKELARFGSMTRVGRLWPASGGGFDLHAVGRCRRQLR